MPVANGLRPALTTGEMADLINAILGAAVYDSRTILAEIDAGRIRAFNVGTRQARRPRVTEGEFLRWAQQVLHADEIARLRARLHSVVVDVMPVSGSGSAGDVASGADTRR